MSTETAFALYLRAADDLADVSASRQLDHAMLAAAKAKLSAAQKEYWRAVDGETFRELRRPSRIMTITEKCV